MQYPLDSLVFYGEKRSMGRQVSEKDVTALAEQFQNKGYRQGEEEHYIKGIITLVDWMAICKKLVVPVGALLPAESEVEAKWEPPLLCDHLITCFSGHWWLAAVKASGLTRWWTMRLCRVKRVWADFPAQITFISSEVERNTWAMVKASQHEAWYSDGENFLDFMESTRWEGGHRDVILNTDFICWFQGYKKKHFNWWYL